jgi:hypothetical protein
MKRMRSLLDFGRFTPMIVPETANYRDPLHRELFLSGLRLAAGEAT